MRDPQQEAAFLEYQVNVGALTEAIAGKAHPSDVAVFLVALAGSVAHGGSVTLDDGALRACFDHAGGIGESSAQVKE